MTDHGLRREVDRCIADDEEFARQMRRADAYLWSIVCICLFAICLILMASLSSPGVK